MACSGSRAGDIDGGWKRLAFGVIAGDASTDELVISTSGESPPPENTKLRFGLYGSPPAGDGSRGAPACGACSFSFSIQSSKYLTYSMDA